MSVGHLLAHALRALEEAQKDYIRKEKFCFRDSKQFTGLKSLADSMIVRQET